MVINSHTDCFCRVVFAGLVVIGYFFFEGGGMGEIVPTGNSPFMILT